MPKQVGRPSYNPTVPLENTSEIPLGALLAAAVDGDVVVSSGAPTASADGFPRSGRIAKDTSTSPATYYIGDGSSWQVVETWAELQVTEGGVGTPHNPDTADLGGSNAEVTVSGAPHNPYVLRVDSTSSTATLQGVTGSAAREGAMLVLMGTTGGQTNTVTVEDGNGTATDPFQNPNNEDLTIDADTDVIVYVYAEGDWRHQFDTVNRPATGFFHKSADPASQQYDASTDTTIATYDAGVDGVLFPLQFNPADPSDADLTVKLTAEYHDATTTDIVSAADGSAQTFENIVDGYANGDDGKAIRKLIVNVNNGGTNVTEDIGATTTRFQAMPRGAGSISVS